MGEKWRARLKVPGLYASPSQGKDLQALLLSLGIEKAQSNSRTGTLLVECLLDLRPTLMAELSSFVGKVPFCSQEDPEDPPEDPPEDLGQGLAQVAPQSLGAIAHSLPAMELVRALTTDPSLGLSLDEAKHRLLVHGRNALPQPKPPSAWATLGRELLSAPMLLLGVSAALSLATGGVADAVVIVAVVVIDLGIGFFTERQAARTIASLSGLAPRSTTLIRQGKTLVLPVEEIAPGDVVRLYRGDHVPADLRLFAAEHLLMDESALTGESVPVSKDPDAVLEAKTPLAERANMAFMGTTVADGGGWGIAVGTGAQTHLGEISILVGKTATISRLENELDTAGRELALASGAVCALVFVAGYAQGLGLLPMLKLAMSLAVAAVPEGLPAVATSALALGVRGMRRQGVLVRRLQALENLGAVDVFCVDKTGTLTQNRMQVTVLCLGGEDYTCTEDGICQEGRGIDPFAPENEEILWFLKVLALCNESVPAESKELLGTPTENALLRVAMSFLDIETLRQSHARLEVQYRSPGCPFMATLHILSEDRRLLAVKGSPPDVLARSRTVMRQGKVVPLDALERSRIDAENERLAGAGQRVLGVAFAVLPEDAPFEVKELVWLGLASMEDPLRPGARNMMATLRQAGIHPIVITGDQGATAYAVAKALDLGQGGQIRILEAGSLDTLDEEVLAGLVRQMDVFARVSAIHKLRIVNALKKTQATVAMTGDGVNDGPAMKAADVSVAMGKEGTDLARLVADVVLEEDDLDTIPRAIAYGRTTRQNIQKAVHFLLSTNFSEIGTVLSGILLGRGEILSSMHLLWINLATDVFPSLALCLDPPASDVLSRPPEAAKTPIMGKNHLLSFFLQSGAITAGTMGAHDWALRRYGLGMKTNTVSFTTIVMAQLLQASSCRSPRPFSLGEPRNPYLFWTIAGTAALQAATFFPPLRSILGTLPLGGADLAIGAAGAAVPYLLTETSKLLGTGRKKTVALANETLPPQPGENPPGASWAK